MALYNERADQCTQCGLRFQDKQKMSLHYDWHFRHNRLERQKVISSGEKLTKKQTKKAISRSWYMNEHAWVTDDETPQTTENSVPTPFEVPKQEEIVVPLIFFPFFSVAVNIYFF